MIRKEISQTSIPNPQYILKKRKYQIQGAIFVVLMWNSRPSIIILFWKYLVYMKSEAWLNAFLEYINGKLFAVHKPATPFK
jgi:hypothetical protein